eukprot:gene13434-19290_t
MLPRALKRLKAAPQPALRATSVSEPRLKLPNLPSSPAPSHHRDERIPLKLDRPADSVITGGGAEQRPPSAMFEAASTSHRTISSDFLSFEPQPGVRMYLVVLNYKLPKAAGRLLKHSAFTLCADGGSNRLYDSFPYMLNELAHQGPSGSSADVAAACATCGSTCRGASSAQHEELVIKARAEHLPNLILGDLDSVRQDVRDFYTSQGVEVIDQSHDQDSTDLVKCIQYLETHHLPNLGASIRHHIIVVGALGGRLDHTLSNLNALYQHSHLNITMWGEGNLVRLVRGPGRTVITPHRGLEGPQCGLVPLGPPVIATCTGLKWNMDKLQLAVGGLLSTSNVIEEDEIVVDADGNMLWTTELHLE